MEFGPRTTWDLGIAVAVLAALAVAARPQYLAAIGLNGDVWSTIIKDFCSAGTGVIGAMLMRTAGGLVTRPPSNTRGMP